MRDLLTRSALAAALIAVGGPATASAEATSKMIVTERYGKSCRGSVEGFPVLVLRGTHRERGEAHGFLGAREIIRTCETMAGTVNAMVQPKTEGGGWEAAKKMVSRFRFPARFRAELDGMMHGLKKALPQVGDRTLKATGAEVTLADLEVLQCGDVLELMRCSQFSAWGSLTPDGGTIIGRNWDYPPIFPFDTYCLFAVAPAEKGLQKTMEAMWFGMIGAGMGCLNEGGVYLSANDAGDEDPGKVQSPTPAALALRVTAETVRADHPLAAVEENLDQKTALAILYHLVAPAEAQGQAARAFVFEHAPGATTPIETRIRRSSRALPEALILTNDPLLGKGKGGSEICERYACLEKTLRDPETRGRLDFERAHTILDAVAVSKPTLTTQYSAVVWPAKKEVRLAVAPAPGQSAPRQKYVRVRWDEVFGRR